MAAVTQAAEEDQMAAAGTGSRALERFKKAGSSSRRQESIEKWVNSITPEGESDRQPKLDAPPAAVPGLDDDLSLGAEARLLQRVPERPPATHTQPDLTPGARTTPPHRVGNSSGGSPQAAAPSLSTSSAYSREMTWRTKLALMGLIRLDSIKSDVENKKYETIDEVLQDRATDPEVVLTNLGFGAQAGMAASSRVPERFLTKKSRATGISVQSYLDNNPELRDYMESRGVTMADETAAIPDPTTKPKTTFLKVARTVSMMKKAAARMQQLSQVFPGMTYIRSTVDDSLMVHMEPIDYVAPSGDHYSSILHPDNNGYRAEQGLYVNPQLSKRRASLRLMHDIKDVVEEEPESTPKVRRRSKSPLPYPVFSGSGDQPGSFEEAAKDSGSLRVQETAKDSGSLRVPLSPRLERSRAIENEENALTPTVGKDVTGFDDNNNDSQHTALPKIAVTFTGDQHSETISHAEESLLTPKIQPGTAPDFIQNNAKNMVCNHGNDSHESNTENIICEESIICDTQFVTQQPPDGSTERQELLKPSLGEIGVGQQSFDLEEVLSGDTTQDEVSSTSTRGHARVRDRGVLQRDTSLQSASSGFAESEDTTDAHRDNNSSTQHGTAAHKVTQLRAGLTPRSRKALQSDTPLPGSSSTESKNSSVDTCIYVTQLGCEMSGQGALGSAAIVQMYENSPQHETEKFVVDGENNSEIVNNNIIQSVEEAFNFDDEEPPPQSPTDYDQYRRNSLDKSAAIRSFAELLSSQEDLLVLNGIEEEDEEQLHDEEVENPVAEQLRKGSGGKSPDAAQEFGEMLYQQMKEEEKDENVVYIKHLTPITSEASSSDEESRKPVPVPRKSKMIDPSSAGDGPGKFQSDEEPLLIDLGPMQDDESSPESPKLYEEEQDTATEDLRDEQMKKVLLELQEKTKAESSSSPDEDPTTMDTVSALVRTSIAGIPEANAKKSVSFTTTDTEDDQPNVKSKAQKKTKKEKKKKKNVKKERRSSAIETLVKMTLDSGRRMSGVDPQDISDFRQKRDSMTPENDPQKLERDSSSADDVERIRGSALNSDVEPRYDLDNSTLKNDTDDDRFEEVVWPPDQRKKWALNPNDRSFDTERPSFLDADYDDLENFVASSSKEDEHDEPQVDDTLVSSGYPDDIDEYPSDKQQQKRSSWPIEPNVNVQTLNSPLSSDQEANPTPQLQRESTLEKIILSQNDLRYLDKLAISLAMPEAASKEMPKKQRSSSFEDIKDEPKEESLKSPPPEKPESSPISKLMKAIRHPKSKGGTLKGDKIATDHEDPGSPGLTKTDTTVQKTKLFKKDDKSDIIKLHENNLPESPPGKKSPERKHKKKDKSDTLKKTESPFPNKKRTSKSKNKTDSLKSRDLMEPEDSSDSPKPSRSSLRKSKTLASANDLPKTRVTRTSSTDKAPPPTPPAHNKGRRISRPTLHLRRKRKESRSKSVPAVQIDAESLKSLQQKESKRGISSWLKNIIHSPNKKRDEPKVTSLDSATIPESIEPSQLRSPSSLSEASSKWGVTDSDATDVEEGKAVPVALGALVSQSAACNAQVMADMMVDRQESGPTLMPTDSDHVVSSLHVDLKRTNSLDLTPHKNELLLVIDDGRVKEVKQVPAAIPPECTTQAEKPRNLTLPLPGKAAKKPGPSVYIPYEGAGPLPPHFQGYSNQPTGFIPLYATPAGYYLSTPVLTPNSDEQKTIGDPSSCPLIEACDLDTTKPVYYKSQPDMCLANGPQRAAQSSEGDGHQGAARSEDCLHSILGHLMKQPSLADLPIEKLLGEAPSWSPSGGDTRQHLLNEVKLLQHAVQKYKLEFRALEIRVTTDYVALGAQLTAEEKLSLDSLAFLRAEIRRELSTLEDHLEHRLRLIVSAGPQEVARTVPVDLAGLRIIQQMIELLKEQVYHNTVISTVHEASQPSTELRDLSADLHRHDSRTAPPSTQSLMYQMALLQQQVENQQVTTATTLSSQLKELRDTLVEEIRHSVYAETQQLRLQVQSAENRLASMKLTTPRKSELGPASFMHSGEACGGGNLSGGNPSAGNPTAGNPSMGNPISNQDEVKDASRSDVDAGTATNSGSPKDHQKKTGGVRSPERQRKVDSLKRYFDEKVDGVSSKPQSKSSVSNSKSEKESKRKSVHKTEELFV